MQLNFKGVINSITTDCHNTSKQLSYIKEILNLNFGQSENFTLFSLVLFHLLSWIIVQSDGYFSICHLEFLSNQMATFPSTILNSCPITGRVAILNYCPIRWLLSIHYLAFLSNQRWLAPMPSPWHRTLSSRLLIPEKHNHWIMRGKSYLSISLHHTWV